MNGVPPWNPVLFLKIADQTAMVIRLSVQASLDFLKLQVIIVARPVGFWRRGWIGLLLLVCLLLICLLFSYAVKLFFHFSNCLHYRNEKIKNKTIGKVNGESKEDVFQHCAKLVKYNTLYKAYHQGHVKCWVKIFRLFTDRSQCSRFARLKSVAPGEGGISIIS